MDDRCAGRARYGKCVAVRETPVRLAAIREDLRAEGSQYRRNAAGVIA